MFPINYNDPYIKPDGSVVPISSVLGGGGSGNTVIYSENAPSDDEGDNDDVYVHYKDMGRPPDGYKYVEYVGTTSSGPYIDSGVEQKIKSYFDVDMKFTANPTSDTWAFGTGSGTNANEIGYYSGQVYFYIKNTGTQRAIDNDRHLYQYKNDGCYIDGVKVNSNSGVDWADKNYYIFARNGGSVNGQINNCIIYSCKIYDDTELVRDFIPMLKISDNTYGLYDLVHDVFYPNIGTGAFIGGDVIDGKRVINTYIKIDDAWEILESGSYIE